MRRNKTLLELWRAKFSFNQACPISTGGLELVGKSLHQTSLQLMRSDASWHDAICWCRKFNRTRRNNKFSFDMKCFLTTFREMSPPTLRHPCLEGRDRNWWCGDEFKLGTRGGVLCVLSVLWHILHSRVTLSMSWSTSVWLLAHTLPYLLLEAFEPDSKMRTWCYLFLLSVAVVPSLSVFLLLSPRVPIF